MTFDLQEYIGLTGLHLPEDGTLGRRATSFASGANSPQEIFGFGSLGIPPGLDADRIVPGGVADTAVLEAIGLLAGTGVPVFLGNGSHSEFASGIPIGAEEWRQRLDLYERVAQDLGRQLYVTAPDKIHDQAETLARLQLFAFDMHLVALAGANVLLPMAGGDLAHDEFQSIAQDILGSPVIPSFPMKEGITDAREVIDFVQSTLPAKIHLQGVEDADTTQALLKTLWDIQPDLLVSQDVAFLKGEDLCRPSDLPLPGLLDGLEAEDGPFEGEKVRQGDPWVGWMVRQAFLNHPAAHQYPGIEALCTEQLGHAPDLASPEFTKGVRDLLSLHACGKDGHA